MVVRIREIIIENFKSYKDLVTVSNLKEFNVICGCNGSGKSNFMDAIAFAFGENISRLRITDYSRIGFNSMSDRITFAAVIFQLDQTSEIIFKRTVKNGRNYYTVNNQDVARTEYQSKLMEIGINIKSGYFISYQGEETDSIEKNAEKNRTKQLEEICGSIKYKQEYDRLKREIEKNRNELKDLQDQKSLLIKDQKNHIAFKKHDDHIKKLLANYETIEMNIILLKLYVAEQNMNFVIKKIKQIKKGKDELKKHKTNAYDNLSQKKSELDEEKQKLISVKGEINSITVKLIGIEQELTTLSEKIALIEQKISNNKKSLKHLKQAYESQLKSVEELKRQYKDIVEIKLNPLISQFSQEYNTEDMLQKKQEYYTLAENINKKTAHLKTTRKENDKEWRKLSFNLDEIKKQIVTAENVIKKIDDSIKNKRHSYQEQKEQLKKKLVDLNELRAQKKNLFAEYETKEVKLKNDLENIQTQLIKMRKNKTELEKHRKKIVLISELKNMLGDNVYGYLSDLIKPIHKRYVTAVAAILETYLSTIIVSNKEVRDQCITILKSKKLGRATFLALDTLTVPPLKDSLRDPTKYGNIKEVRLLRDVVKYPPEIKNAIFSLLGDTLVCENVEDADHIVYKLKSGGTHDCITLKGSYFRADGMITTGMYDIEAKRAFKVFDDKSDLEDKEIELQANIRELQKQRNDLNLIEIENEILIITKSLDILNSSSGDKLKTIKEELITSKNDTKMKLTNLMRDKETIEKKMKTVSELINEINNNTESIETELYADFCKGLNIDNIHKFRNSLEKFEKLRSEESDLMVHLQKIKEQLSFLERMNDIRNVEKLTKHIADLQGGLKEKKDAYEQSNINKNKNIITLILLKESYSERETIVNQLNNQVNIIQGNIDQNLNNFRTNIASYNHYSHLLQDAYKNYLDILWDSKLRNINLSFIQGSYESIQSFNEYDYNKKSTEDILIERENTNIELNYTTIDRIISERNNSIEEITEEIGNLEKLLDDENKKILECSGKSMGIQDLEIIQEKLKNTKARFNELSKLVAEDTKKFNTIKEKRRETFIAAFDIAAESIKNIYNKLCGNEYSQAFLDIVRDDEPFLNDIHYVCIPPGKRYVDCNNLSGGEKTIASLAYMFALLKVNPSPILLLDEADTSLDQHHLNSIIKYINEIKVNHQIIYITFNENACEYANFMIGIYSVKTGLRKMSMVAAINMDPYPI